MGNNTSDPAKQKEDRSERRRYLDVVEEVLRAVALGTISSGDRLPNERDLAARCAVSRSSVREAMLALELSGVVDVRPGAGAFLTGVGLHIDPLLSPPIDASPRELLEVRQVIEPEVSRLSAHRARKGDLRRLEELVEEADACCTDSSAEDLDHFVKLNLGFHRELARTCGNAILVSFIGHLVNAGEHPLWLLIDGIVVRDASTRARQVEEHRTILHAVARGRGDEAAEAMTAHLGALFARIFGAEGDPPKVRRTRRQRRT